MGIIYSTVSTVGTAVHRPTAELVRYADDFVILMRGGGERTQKKVQEMMQGLGLRLNEAKTKVIDARQGSFEFLGFSFARKLSFKSAKMMSHRGKANSAFAMKFAG